MNSLDPLSQLNPLREPVAIDWWPPAPGWWIIFCGIIVLISIFIFVLIRRYKNQLYRKHAIIALDKMLLESENDTEHDFFPSKVNALLKTVALKTYSKKEIATLSGSNWLNFLKLAPGCESAEAANFVLELYRPLQSSFTRSEIHAFAKTWIKVHR